MYTLVGVRTYRGGAAQRWQSESGNGSTSCARDSPSAIAGEWLARICRLTVEPTTSRGGVRGPRGRAGGRPRSGIRRRLGSYLGT